MAFFGIISRIQQFMLLHASVDRRINYLRRQGVKIGQKCIINTLSFSTEPFLIELGDEVLISDGTKFITHDGSVRCLGDEFEGGLFGRIKIGNNVFIGIDCIILLNSTIGNNCIIGAGSVVRGHFPDNSVIVGNPAQVVLNINIQKMLNRYNSGIVKTNSLTSKEARKLVKKHFGIE